MKTPLKKRLMELSLIGIAFIAGLLVIEAFISIPLWFPGVVNRLPASARDKVINYYLEVDREVIQFNPQCAKHDPQLFYTLKPGSCDTREREFSVHYEINSQGLRDSESALKSPELVVIGDSFAMGWGVPQEKTFAKRIETAWGRKVLNSGISSYGTAREVLMLERLDTSRLQYLVVQHCNNDPVENTAFVENGYSLPPRSLSAYEEVLEEQRALHRYYPGRRVRHLVSQLATPRLLSHYFSTAPYSEQAEVFLKTLSVFAKRHPKVKILVFETNSHALNYPDFIKELNGRKADSRYPESIRNLVAEDFSATLVDQRYHFALDGHLNELGHEWVAEKVMSRLKSGW